MVVMRERLVARVELDEQDRVAILQMLELTASERVAYLVDEVEFEEGLAARLGASPRDG